MPANFHVRRKQNIIQSVLVLIAVSLAFADIPAMAEPLGQEMIPPDVTLQPATPVASPASASANTTTGAAAAAAAVPGVQAPGAAAPASTPSRPGAIYTPPGQAPAAPPPPVAGSNAPPPAGSGTFGRPSTYGSGLPFPNTSPTPATMPDLSKDPLAVIETNKGTITIRLFKSLAPKTVANFIDLAQKGFYNGLKWHRVEKGFCIQGGDPQNNGTGLYIDPQTKQPHFIELETSALLKHNAPGVVAMARFGTSPNSASCQFYITLAPAPSLDGQYGIFGGVVSGMDVVNNIAVGDVMSTVSVKEP